MSCRKRCCRRAGSTTRSSPWAKRCMRPVTFAGGGRASGNHPGVPAVPRGMRVSGLVLVVALVARADEQTLAHERLPEIQKDAPTFSAILAHLGITPAASYTKDQELAIYRDWKMLNALRLDQVSGGFHFLAVFGTPQQASRVDGTIDQRGNVAVATRTPSGQPPCPICLARGTRIATPSGDIAVEDLRVGDVVWTLDAAGSRVALPLVDIGSTPVPATHRIVQLRL